MSDNADESPSNDLPQDLASFAVADPEIPELTYDSWAAQTKTLVESIYDGISAPFCCGGTLRVPRPVQVTTVQDNVPFIVQPPPTQFPGNDADVDAAKEMVKAQGDLLREFVEKAPLAVFGKGSEAMYDTSVRNGKQLQAADFTTNIEPDMLRDVLRQIQSDLGLGVGIQAEPYSINIYEEGGLFESHKDTPRGRDMFGTLVLCLPSLFLGGALQVGMSQGTTHSFFGKHLDHSTIPFQENLSGHPSWWRFSSDDATSDGAVDIPWCAFFSDADHRVSPVRKGVRVALSYLLRRTDGASSSDLAPPRVLAETEEQGAALVEAFRSIKSNPFKPRVRVGVPRDHLYTTSEIWPHKDPPRELYDIKNDGNEHDEGAAKNLNRLTPGRVGRLKGRDALLARAAAAAGLQVFLMPFLNTRNGADATPEAGDDYFITDFEAEFLNLIDGPYGGYCESMNKAFDPPPELFYPGEWADIWIKGHHDGAIQRKCAVGYFGNGPATIEEYYLHAALLLEPYPPCTFRFTAGELNHEVPIHFQEDGPTLWDVIEGSRRRAKMGNLFNGPRIASALNSSTQGAAEASPPPPSPVWTLEFEVQEALEDPDRPDPGRYDMESFLGLTPAYVAGMVAAGTDPVVIAVTVEKRDREGEGGDDEFPSMEPEEK